MFPSFRRPGRRPSIRLLAALALVLVLMPAGPVSAADPGSFAAFYREDSYTNWWDWTLIGGTAVAAGVITFYTAGTVPALAGSIGGFVGKLFGFSGIVAQNFGLALLGGGPIAAGGLGIQGGVALLTTLNALAFESAVQFAVVENVDAYFEASDYRDLVAKSQSMITFPLPRAADGSQALEDMMHILHTSKGNAAPMTDPSNADALEKALWISFDIGQADEEEIIQYFTLRALVEFWRAEFQTAADSAAVALEHAETNAWTGSFPAFLHLVASLYDPDIDKAESHSLTHDLFGRTVAETDNGFLPLMVALLMDRLELLYLDGRAHERTLRLPARFVLERYDGEEGFAAALVVATRYLNLLQVQLIKLNALFVPQPSLFPRQEDQRAALQETYEDLRRLTLGLGFLLADISLGDLTEAEREIFQKLRNGYLELRVMDVRLSSQVFATLLRSGYAPEPQFLPR